MSRPTVTVDREFYIRLIRSVNACRAVLPPSVASEVPIKLTRLADAQAELGKLSQLAESDELPAGLGACEPPLTIEEVEGTPDSAEPTEPEGNGQALASITTLHKPNAELVAELETLLGLAKSGELRGMLYVGYRNAGAYRFGNSGEYSLGDFALGVKLLELELDSIVTHGRAPDADTPE